MPITRTPRIHAIIMKSRSCQAAQPMADRPAPVAVVDGVAPAPGAAPCLLALLAGGQSAAVTTASPAARPGRPMLDRAAPHWT